MPRPNTNPSGALMMRLLLGEKPHYYPMTKEGVATAKANYGRAVKEGYPTFSFTTIRRSDVTIPTEKVIEITTKPLTPKEEK